MRKKKEVKTWYDDKVCKTLWISEALEIKVKRLNINVSDICRKALDAEAQRLSTLKRR